MKTLSSSLTTQTSAAQSGWCELYDFYLPAPIATPFGTTATLRLTTLPGGLAFFTPKVSPEPSGTQGNAQAYTFWPVKRQIISGSSKFTNDKLTISASNVTGDWATMLSEVDWDSVAVTVRKVSTSITSPTADDCAVIFSGTIDSAIVNLEVLQFTVSNDLGTFAVTAPRENMHASCRFSWGDDQCTMLRYHANNYKTKTCDSGSSVTNVKCSRLTEDTGAKGSYGTDLVAALADAAITSSSGSPALSGVGVTFIAGSPSYFMFFSDHSSPLSLNEAVVFAATTMPTGLTAGVTYYVCTMGDLGGYKGYTFSATSGGSVINVSSIGAVVTVSTPDYSAYYVKTTRPGSYWAMDLSSGDWGTLTQGYWQIPDAQNGIRNHALTPWIQFDFGSNKQPKLWQVAGINSGSRQDLPRLIEFFSSTDNSTWKFECYFELPPIIGGVFDVLIPGAQNARYWRICVRSRWSTDVRAPLFAQVSAYAGSRHYWQNGRVTFSSSTTTAALQGVSRAILESYAGELICAPLPAAPVSGDTFTIERGCSRLFNACAARLNVENFGGFNTLPFVQITVNP